MLVDLKVTGGRCCNETGCDHSPELTDKEFIQARGIIIIDSYPNKNAL